MFGKDWVKGVGVRVWGGEDPVEPNRGDVRGDEVVSIGVLNVVVGLGKKAFESCELGKRIGGFETRRPEHVEMGHEGWLWRVERGSLKECLEAGMGRNFRPMGTCELNFFLPMRGLPAMKAVGVRIVRSASEKLE